VKRTKILLTFLSACLLLFIHYPGAAQKAPARLRYAFATGQRVDIKQEETTNDFEENLVEGSKSESSTLKEIAQQWQVVGVTPGGESTIEVKYTWLQLRRRLQPGVVLTLDTRRSAAEVNPILIQLGPQGVPILERFEMIRKLIMDVFVGRTYKMVVSDVGKVKSFSGFDQAWEDYRLKVEKLIPDKGKRAELDALIEAFFGEEAVHKLFSYSLFVSLPEEPAGVGHEWSDSTDFSLQSIHLPIKRNYKLTSVSDTGKSFKIDGKVIFDPPTATEEVEFKIPGNTLTAEISLDPANGTLLAQTYSGKLEFEAYGRQAPNNRRIIHLVSETSGRVLMTTGQPEDRP